MSIPTTQQAVDAAIAAIESRLGQDVPTYEKSFLNVVAVVLGMNNAELYRFGVQRTKQVLALTATGSDLDQIGREYGVIRKAARKAELYLTVTYDQTVDGTITRTDVLQSPQNELYYFPIQDFPYTVAGTTFEFEIQVRAEFAGVSGNLSRNDEMVFGSPPPGISELAVVDVFGPQVLVQAGSDEETDDELRLRILDEIQTVGGGSNLADYRTWGQQSPNVARIDPYTGSAPWSGSIPGERTVFVEAAASYDPDGIADTLMLAEVEQYINYDPDTGRRRPCLGSTDDTLYIESITRNTAYVLVTGLVVESTRLLECQNAITSSVDTLIRGLRPFISGLDAEIFRNDFLTSSLVSRDVQRVIRSYGGSVDSVYAGLTYGVWQAYMLSPGERLKADVSFA